MEVCVPMNTSNLESEIKRMIASASVAMEPNGNSRIINCQIDVARHYQIGVLADRLHMTTTGLAEHLLGQAINIAWNAAGLGVLADADINAMSSASKMSVGEATWTNGGTDIGKQLPESHSATEPPNRLTCLEEVFQHFGLERGRTKGTVATARDGTLKVCCLISKDYNSRSRVAEGERYWFTIYDNQIDDIRQSRRSFVAFACGVPEQIVLIPLDDFCGWTDELPPYTQGKTGWHIHLSTIGGKWTIRRKGYGEAPIDVTRFLLR
jgi:hypothetical protein